MIDFIFQKTKLPSQEEIDKFESIIGFPLPLEYRVYLQRFGGGASPKYDVAFRYTDPGILYKDHYTGEALLAYLSSAVFDDEGVSELMIHYHYMNSNQRENNFIPADMIVIGNDPGSSNVLLGINGEQKGKVFFWDVNLFPHEDNVPETYENISFVADSFTEFLDSLYLFNE